jgi:hypothetical protein
MFSIYNKKIEITDVPIPGSKEKPKFKLGLLLMWLFVIISIICAYLLISSFRYWMLNPELTQMQLLFNLDNILLWK